MLLSGKRIFTHPSISTFYNVMDVSRIKLLKLSKLSKTISSMLLFYLCLPGKHIPMYHFCVSHICLVTRVKK